MKKVLPKILIILNILLIVFLLFVSGVMLFMSSSSQKYLFGRSAVVYTNVVNNVPEYKLLFLQKDTAELNIGDRVVYFTTDFQQNKAYFVDTISAVSEDIIFFESEKDSIEQASPNLLGKVTGENQWLGEVLYSIQNSGNRLTLYILILSGFMILSIAAILLLIVSERNKNGNKKEAATTQKPMIDIEIDDMSDTIAESNKQEEAQDTPPIFKASAANKPITPRNAELEIIYEEETNSDGKIVRKPKAVTPAPLSQSNLSSNNPLFSPHGDYSTPPTNIGSQKVRRFVPFEERNPQADLVKEDTGELDLSAFYEVMEHTSELIYTEELVADAKGTISPQTEAVSVEKSKPLSRQSSPKEEPTVAPQESLDLNFDSLLDDIISQAQNDLYSDKKD